MKASDASVVSLVDLDRTLSFSVARARHAPILVTNRHQPWVWLVSHERWWRERQYRGYLPDTHPLVGMREIADRHLAQWADALPRLAAELGLRIAPRLLCRALCLRAVYSMPGARALYQSIGYNMTYRYAVGLDSSEVLWPYPDFESDVEQLGRHEVVAGMVASVVRQCATLPQAETEFRIEPAATNAEANAESQSECCGGVRCLSPRYRWQAGHCHA